jgi:hypothetical protein
MVPMPWRRRCLPSGWAPTTLAAAGNAARQLAGRLLAQIENLLPDDMRGPEGEAPFGPKVEVPGSAPAADRLAAFQGRRP